MSTNILSNFPVNQNLPIYTSLGLSGSGGSIPYMFSIDGMAHASFVGIPLLTFGCIAATTVILAYVTISENPESVKGFTSSVSSVSNTISDSMGDLRDNVQSIKMPEMPEMPEIPGIKKTEGGGKKKKTKYSHNEEKRKNKKTKKHN